MTGPTLGGPDRWERFFSDVVAELEASEAAERVAEVVDRTRYERGRVELVDRLRAGIGVPVLWHLRGGTSREAATCEVGRDWALAQDGQGRTLLVALAGVEWVGGLPAAAVAPPAAQGRVRDAIDLRMMLRRLCMDRVSVRVPGLSGGAVTGVMQWVGADFVELAAAPFGESPHPRRGAGGMSRTVPLRAITLVELPPQWLATSGRTQP